MAVRVAVYTWSLHLESTPGVYTWSLHLANEYPGAI